MTPNPESMAVAHAAAIEVLGHFHTHHGELPAPRIVVEVAVGAYVWAETHKLPLGPNQWAMPTRTDLITALTDGTIPWGD